MNETEQSPPGVDRLIEPGWASESDASGPCPWCGWTITRGEAVVHHNVQTPVGIAPLAVLHAACSEEQIEHEENFGGR